MGLRLDKDGLRVLDEWRRRCTPQDVRLVAEVLGSVARQKWQSRWHSSTSDSEPGVTVIQPRPGLHVHIGLWAEDEGEFTLVSISGVPPEEEQD